MTTPLADDEELSELTDAQFGRVDLVGKGANGVPRFLVVKADGESQNLLDAGFVRDLIAKSEPPASEEQVTMTGSPAAIASLIHKAAQRSAPAEAEPDDVAKATLSSAELNNLPDSAFAYVEPGGTKDSDGKTTPRSLRHFAIHDKAHADNAAARIAQGAKFGAEAKPKVEAAQRKFGETVSKETGVPGTEPVTKDMAGAGPELDDGIDGLDPTVPLAAPEDDDAPGDPTDPGSPAWEAIDAATACKWTSILARARVAIDILAEREFLESASADPDDIGNAFDLEDACCAIDYVISVLAPYAVAEQSEADTGTDAMAAITKAMAGIDAVPMDRIELLSTVAKAGRVLSASNEAEIRSAAASLQKVLTSLPAAPVADDQPVAKETAMPEDTAAAETEPAVKSDAAETSAAAQPAEAEDVLKAVGYGKDGAPFMVDLARITKAEAGHVLVCDREGAPLALARPGEVVKADGEKPAMVAVYNQGGKLVGIVDPAEITPIQGADAPEEKDDAAPAADDADMTPAPAADAGTPAGAPALADDDVTKQEAPTQTQTETTPDASEVLTSIVTKAVTAVLDARGPAEDVARQADVAALLEEIAVLKGRVKTVEDSPAAPKVFTNGQTPPADQLRGQDRGAAGQPVSVAKAAALRTQFRNADPAEQTRLANEMQTAAIGMLGAVHGRT